LTKERRSLLYAASWETGTESAAAQQAKLVARAHRRRSSLRPGDHPLEETRPDVPATRSCHDFQLGRTNAVSKKRHAVLGFGSKRHEADWEGGREPGPGRRRPYLGQARPLSRKASGGSAGPRSSPATQRKGRRRRFEKARKTKHGCSRHRDHQALCRRIGNSGNSTARDHDHPGHQAGAGEGKRRRKDGTNTGGHYQVAIGVSRSCPETDLLDVMAEGPVPPGHPTRRGTSTAKGAWMPGTQVTRFFLRGHAGILAVSVLNSIRHRHGRCGGRGLAFRRDD